MPIYQAVATAFSFYHREFITIVGRVELSSFPIPAIPFRYNPIVIRVQSHSATGERPVLMPTPKSSACYITLYETRRFRN